MCGMSSLPDILWTVVFGSVALVIGVSLRFTSSRPKHSNNATEILVHSNRVMVSFSSPKQLTTYSRKPWYLYGIQTELWFVYGMSSLPDILWPIVSLSWFQTKWTNISAALFECAKLQESHGICTSYKVSSILCENVIIT